MTMEKVIHFSKDDTDRDCDVEFRPVKAYPETWGYWGGTPYEPASAEDLTVLCDGEDVTDMLTEGERESLEEDCLEYADELAFDNQYDTIREMNL
jgi:hypothetical protein